MSEQYDQRLKKARAMDRYLSKNAYSIQRQSSYGFRVNFDGDFERNSNNTNEIHNRIASVREAYENVGIIGNIIDLMVDFALEGLTIEHKNDQIRNFFQHWAAKVDLYSLSEEILKGIYRDGNVPILAFRGEIQDEEFKTFKRTIAQDDLFSIEPKSKNIIPFKYVVLDVIRLHRFGSPLLGNVEYEYQLSATDLGLMKRQNEIDSVRRFRQELGEPTFEKIMKTGRIPLPRDRFSILFYKKDSYKPWANPMLWRVIDDVKFKKLLRDMDISVAESVVNSLTFVKLGNTVEGFPSTEGKMRKMSSLMKNISKSRIIVWDDLVDIESDFPPVEKILGAEKYEQVNDDIRSGLGVAEVLINGQGENFANSFLSVRTLLERLETGREILTNWIESQIEVITKNMGFRRKPIVRMKNMSLMDEEAERKFLIELYDRNLVSAESMVDRFGESFDREIIRMQREDRIREQLRGDPPFRLLKVGKFGPMAGEFMIEEPIASTPTSQEREGDSGGRPPGTRRRQSGPPGIRKSRPQGASQRDYLKRIREAYDVFRDSILKINSSEKIDPSEEETIIDLIKDIPVSIARSSEINKDSLTKALNNSDMYLDQNKYVKKLIEKNVKSSEDDLDKDKLFAIIATCVKGYLDKNGV